MSVSINISLMGSLRDKTPDSGTLRLEQSKSCIQDLLNALDIPIERVHVVTVNGRFEHDFGRVLQAGDAVSVLPITFSHACEVPAENS